MEDASNSFTNPQVISNNLPSWEEIEFEPLAPNAPWPPFWSGSLSAALFLGAATTAVFTTPLTLFTYIVIALSGLALFALAQWHSFTEHKRRGVALRDKDIAFKKGLFWRQHTLLPFNRVQHIEIHRGPIERKLGLSSLRLFTAGGTGVDLQISGLEKERAERIKEFILDKTKDKRSLPIDDTPDA